MKDAPCFGLDVGTSRVVLAYQAGGGFSFRSQLNAFVQIPYSKITEGVLKKEQVPYTVAQGDLVIHGNESERFADLLGQEARRPMRSGLLNPAEVEGEKQLGLIFRALLGEEDGNGRKIYFTVPAAPLGAEENLTYHEATIRNLLSGMGYQVEAINEGLAVVYGELESSNFTGIGVSCGGGLCNVCLAYLSVPVLSFSVPKAGDFIDSSAAAAMGELATRIRIAKETDFHFNGNYSDKAHQVLSVFYDDMITTLVTAMKEAFSNTKKLPRLGRPVPLVLSGGSVMPRGFRERFEQVLRNSNFPLALSEVRVASEPLHSTAKGALVAALSEA
ncbi:MAG: hypothetical protein NZV14_13425 [Bryobacteraceae bacterium]|nr:hypothetical protein [Bryobacteraceae bacterium]MDW8379158.1 hypothetical protein [Bryobacterales bacterium]